MMDTSLFSVRKLMEWAPQTWDLFLLLFCGTLSRHEWCHRWSVCYSVFMNTLPKDVLMS